MRSSELLALSNLDGWRISEGYSIILKHGLMGRFPALVSKTGKDFVCLSEEAVKEAVSLLSNRPYSADPTLFLVNEKERIAFMLPDVEAQWKNNVNQRGFKLEHRIDYDSESLVILMEEDLKNMKAGDLKWAPGLVGSGTTPKEFAETLSAATRCSGSD
ncbi:MAG: hypothetical protein ABIG29_00280 [Candidatus Nealsonbacteria bacterium]